MNSLEFLYFLIAFVVSTLFVGGIVGALFDRFVYTHRLQNFLAYQLHRLKRKFQKGGQK